MTVDWTTDPPSQELYTYAPEFAKYAQRRLALAKSKHNFNFNEWFMGKRTEIETNPLDYRRNLKIVKMLIPVFEENPSAWKACTYLHSIKGKNQLAFEDYLQKWSEKCPDTQTKKAVQKIADLFGLFVKI